MTSTRLPGATPTVRGGGQELGGVSGGLAARRADPDVHRHGRRLDAGHESSSSRSSATTAPLLLSWSTRAMAPWSSASAICVSTKSTSTRSSSPLTSITDT